MTLQNADYILINILYIKRLVHIFDKLIGDTIYKRYFDIRSPQKLHP